MVRAKKLSGIAGVVVVLALAGSAMAQTPSLTVIEPAPGFTYTFGGSVSRDGSTLIGASARTSTANGFRWSAATQRQDIPAVIATYAVSPDGNTVLVDDGQLWNPITGIQSTSPTPVGRSFDPQAGRPSVGNNGSWIISTFRGSGSSVVPFKWTPSNGWRNLPGFYSLNTNIFDATPDGNSWIGETGDFGGGSQFVYRNNAWETLSFQPRAMSDDARYLAGEIETLTVFPRAVLSTPTGLIDLGLLAGFAGATASDVSNDGRTVVGRVFTPDGLRADAFIWREGVGMQLLSDLVPGLPRDISNVPSISCDQSGTVIAGTFVSPTRDERAFIVVVPSPCTLSLCVFGVMAVRRRRNK